MKPRISYLSTGLLVTVITAILFVWFDVMAFPLLGITCGMVTCSPWRAVRGFLTSAGLGLFASTLLICMCRIPPLDLTIYHFGLTRTDFPYLAGATLGAALQLERGRVIFAAMVGCIIGCFVGNFLVFSLIPRILIPHFSDKNQMEIVWGFASMLATIPLIGIGTWWPVEFFYRNQSAALARVFPLLNTLRQNVLNAMKNSQEMPEPLRQELQQKVIESGDCDRLLAELELWRPYLPEGFGAALQGFVGIVLDAAISTENDGIKPIGLALTELNLEKFYAEAVKTGAMGIR